MKNKNLKLQDYFTITIRNEYIDTYPHCESYIYELVGVKDTVENGYYQCFYYARKIKRLDKSLFPIKENFEEILEFDSVNFAFVKMYKKEMKHYKELIKCGDGH